MPNIEFAGKEFALLAGESVLDCLLRNGHRIPHSCKSGICQSCLMQAQGQAVPEKSQAGLKDTLKAQGYFLACACQPSESLTIRPPGDNLRVSATITSVDMLSANVVRVLLTSASTLEYRPGQFVTLVRHDGLARSYSLASLPKEDRLELHVRKVNGGAMSGWLHGDRIPNRTVQLQGPSGQCFYVPGNPEQPLLLAGTGTGLAPLYGIVRDALSQAHTGQSGCFTARSIQPDSIYLVAELQALSRSHPNFQYVPTVLKTDTSGSYEVAALDVAVLSRFPKLNAWKGYVCGDPALVLHFGRNCFLPVCRHARYTPIRSCQARHPNWWRALNYYSIATDASCRLLAPSAPLPGGEAGADCIH